MSSATPAARHMLAAFRAFLTGNSSPFVKVFPSGGVLMTTGEQHPFSNFAAGLAPDDVAEALAVLAPVDGPAMVIVAGDRDPGFEPPVLAAGFEHGGAMPAMSVGIGRLGSVSLPDGYRFERFVAGDPPEPWSECLAAAYPVPPRSSDTLSPVHVPVDDRPDAPVQFFRVVCGSETAGVSALVLSDGLAGVYCVATREAHRGRGVGAALTAGPLLAAGGLGYEIGVLQSSEAGYPVYRRLGFEDDGCLQVYLRMPEGG